MAYDSRVFRILIASPSDVDEERTIAANVIQEWNDLHSHTRRVTLLPLRWETHTAPEFGKRPQEIINRAVVDDCDLVVGIFWTRLGSATGDADSGTLEEIDRAGAAHKPIMLYFSKIGRDPDEMDLSQMRKLQEFKKKTYPRGLVEHYKSHIDFRDKFSKQLELRVRDLQRDDSAGAPSISLQFIDLATKELLGTSKSESVSRVTFRDLDTVPEKSREKLAALIEEALIAQQAIRLPLAIANLGTSGIQNLFVELSVKSSSKLTKLFDRAPVTRPTLTYNPGLSFTAVGPTGNASFVPGWWDSSYSNDSALSADRLGVLHEIKTGWKLAFEWDSLQPRRSRVIEPAPRLPGSHPAICRVAPTGAC